MHMNVGKDSKIFMFVIFSNRLEDGYKNPKRIK